MTHKATNMREEIARAADDPTTGELRRSNAEMFCTEDGYVRLRWQDSSEAPAVLVMGKDAELLAYGLNAEHVQALADALAEMARVLA